MNKEIYDRGDMLNGENLYRYMRSLVTDVPQFKIGLGALGGIFSSIMGLATELAWTVILLVLCDFLLGVMRAIRDPEIKMKWAEALNTGVKVIIIGVGIIAVHLIELMVFQTTDMDFHGVLVMAFLVAVGVGEATSILDHLSYHFPGFKRASDRIKKVISKELEKDED